MANRFSKLIVESQEDLIDDAFPNEHLMVISMEQAPWFDDFASYLALGILPHGLSSH